MPKQVVVTLPSDREIQVSREFDASARLVWEAHVNPDLVKRWMLGPPGNSMPVCEIDLRVGGAYRYRWRNDEDGSEIGSSGEHREIVPQEKLVTTERMEGFDIETVNTLTLTENGGRTIAAMRIAFPTREARDGALQYDMPDGMGQSYDRLAEMLAGMAEA